jgi:4-amino-4-deoxy-L-arabinose transferase-like glycosyltransferase
MTLATAPRPIAPVVPHGLPSGQDETEAREGPEGGAERQGRSSTGPARRSRAELIALAVLLMSTAAAYLWALTASGYANSFYAAAVQAGTKSWKAFFFGSLDASNFITVDKPPASLWVMELSGRLFGFSSFSMLLPEALMGVATVALVYSAVRRSFGTGAGLGAGVAMAVTPVAALMFRFNNPDALLVLLLTAGAYCLTRALERGSTRWLLAVGVTIGFGFLAKMGEALLVVPAFGCAYLLAAPTPRPRRVLQLLGAGAAMAVSAGWWALIVAWWPAGSRPMIDGSPTNSILNLILEYNGLGRVVGGGGGGGGNFSGATGALRLFNSLMGGQASWLLPAALITLVGGALLTARAPRTDRTRAALVIWGGWLVLAGALFSLSQGVIHTYYTVALAPPIAALAGIGGAHLWKERRAIWARGAAGAVIAITAAWAVVLLDRAPAWDPWLRPLVVAAGALAVVGLVVASIGRHMSAWKRGAALTALAAGAVACVAGPLAFTVQTIGTAHTGSLPSAGPSSSSTGALAGGPGGSAGGAVGSAGGAGGPTGGPGGTAARPGGTAARPGGPSSGGTSTSGGGTPPSSPLGRSGAREGSGSVPAASGSFGGVGHGTGGASVPAALVKVLEAGAGHYRWVAATDGSQSAASLELATGGEPVMAIGGFNNEGGNLSLSAFERYVEAGDIHYYIVSGGGNAGGPGASPGGGSSSSSITAWVKSHFATETVGGEAVYNLTVPTTK